MDPRVRLRRRVAVRRRIVPLSEWVEEENRKGNLCACGCGKPIRVLPRHRAQGIPRYLRAHHPMATTLETRRIREAGLMTATDVAKALGIGATTLLRLEGKLFEPVTRTGKRRIRVFTPEQVELLRKELRDKTRLGPKPKLVGLEELARRAGCAMQTIRRRLGTELPAGRKLTEGSRGRYGFTPDEAKRIMAWARKHFRRRRSTSSATRRTQAR